MKYQVKIQYTNPSHEHVSLRRRVESVTRLVEAANEQEALNRAANQQRALGFLIKEAEIMKEPKEENLHADEKEKKKKKVVGDDEQETDIASAGGVKEEVEQIDEVKAVKAYDKEGKLVGRYRSMEHAKQMKPGHTYKVDESSHKPLLPAQKAVQAKVDAESKKQLAKKPQAGTLAAQKTRKAAEKMVNKAKGKMNKVNLTPEIEPGKPNA